MTPLSAGPLYPLELGQRVVDVAVDAHWHEVRRGEQLSDPCVAAAVAYALAVLYDAGGNDGAA